MINSYQQYLNPNRSVLGMGGYNPAMWESSPESIAMRRQQYELGEYQPQRPTGNMPSSYRDWYRSVTGGINPLIGRLNRRMATGGYDAPDRRFNNNWAGWWQQRQREINLPYQGVRAINGIRYGGPASEYAYNPYSRGLY